MDDLPALLRPRNGDGVHLTAAVARAIARGFVHMQRRQTERTVIPVAAVRQWCDRSVARNTDEAGVFLSSTQSPTPLDLG